MKVTFTNPPAAPVEAVVKTHASGTWKAAANPSPTGSWTAQASFAGDATRKPTTSPPCVTSYE